MRAGARCFSEEGAALEIAARALRAALVMLRLGSLQRHCTSGKSLFFGRRPWYDVPATDSNTKLAAAREPSTRKLALALSRDKAQHSSLLHARAVPRWLWTA